MQYRNYQQQEKCYKESGRKLEPSHYTEDFQDPADIFVNLSLEIMAMAAQCTRIDEVNLDFGYEHIEKTF